MKKLTTILFVLILCVPALAQVSKDYTVTIKLTVLQSPLRFQLNWYKAANATQYKVYSKTPEAMNWTERATLSATDTIFVDSAATNGKATEYQVVSFTPNYNGYGYFYAATNLDAADYRGKLMLVVDSNYITPLAAEIKQLQADLRGDGWQVITRYIGRAASPTKVKKYILDLWKQDSANFKSVYLLGHVPVPYSGYIGPDGHPDHYGAWPADLYYSVVDEDQWTDYVLNIKVSSSSRNYNVPGDGKFDADRILPGTAKLQVGRVDLFDMPAFGLGDTALTRRYLNRAHNFRINKYAVVLRGLIEDAIGGFGGEAFVRGGWASYPGMFGDSIREADFLTELKARPYMFAVTAGFGSYTSSSGIAQTSDFVTDSLTSPFLSLFGSYFGDWDNTNNLLRAPLASRSLILTSCWSGRPVYYHHQMALGETVGYSATASSNSPRSLYHSEFENNGVHLGLLGDPSLRLHPITPPASLILSTSCGGVTVKWNASPDTGIIGHRVYRASSADGKYELLKQATANNFVDANPLPGMNYYIVRAVRLQKTPSGTYYNTSPGIMDSVMHYPAPKAVILVNDTVQCEENNRFVLRNGITNFPLPYNSSWRIDGQTVSYTDSIEEIYTAPGSHVVSFAVSTTSGCYDSTVKTIDIEPTPAGGIALISGGQCKDSTAVQLTTPATGVTYTWAFSDGDTMKTPSVTKQFKDSGKKYVQLIVADLATGCMNDKDTQHFVIKLKPFPKAAMAINDTDQCAGLDKFVIKNDIKNYPYFYTQLWRVDGTPVTYTDSLVRVFGGGVHTVSYTISIPGCYDSIGQNLTVNTNPIANIIMSYLGQCQDSNKINFATNTTGALYNWVFSDGDTLYVQNPSKIFKSSGNHTVQLMVENPATGCKNSSNILPLFIKPKPSSINITGTQFMQLGKEFTYIAHGKPTSTYNWSVSQTPDFMQANKDTLRLKWNSTLLAAVITVVERDSNGCKGDTAYFNVWTIINSIKETDKDFSVYPVPAKENIIIYSHTNTGKSAIHIYDINGKLLLDIEMELLQGENSVNISGLSAGMYYMNIESDGKRTTQKIIKAD